MAQIDGMCFLSSAAAAVGRGATVDCYMYGCHGDLNQSESVVDGAALV